MSTRKYPLIGDVHAQVQDLEDCGRLFDGIEKTLKSLSGETTVIFLGDLHDNHNTVRLEVTEFYSKRLNALKNFLLRY